MLNSLRPKFMSSLVLGLVTLLPLSCGKQTNASLKAQIDPLATDFKIGRGINILSGQALGNCIQTPASIPAFDTEGKQSTLTIGKIESSQDLFKQMGMAAKAKYTTWDGTTGGKTSFTDQFSINRQSLYLYINVKVSNPLFTVSDVSLKQEAVNLFNTQGAEAFRNACGDEFVRSFTSGGEFIAVLEIKTENEAHKKQIDASIKGSYGVSSGSISFSQKLEEAISSNKTDLYIYQSGGSFEHASLSADALMNKAINYPVSISVNNSRPIIAFTAPYKTLLNFPAGPSDLDIYVKEKVLNQLANDDLVLSDMLADVNYLLTEDDNLPNDANYIAKLNQTANAIKIALNTIRQSASSCVSNYKTCTLPLYIMPTLPKPGETSGGATVPVDGGGSELTCIIWIDKKGVPFLKPYGDDSDSKRERETLAIGKTFKWEKLGYRKQYTCKKVQNGIQTLREVLSEPLGYGSDETKEVVIIYS